MLELAEVRSGYGVLEILRGISMQMERGESVALVGVNGAGKTTLVRAIMGLNKVTSGRIEKDGKDITTLAPHQRPRIGIAALLENRRLFGEMSVRDNLKIAEYLGRSSDTGSLRFDWPTICKMFPIIEERKNSAVSLLSGGQQQMVAAARALLLQPDFLILDEPSTGLAPKVVKELFEIFKSLRNTGLGILLIEQNIRIASAMTDRAYVMSLGRIVLQVSGDEWSNFVDDKRSMSIYLGMHLD
jgi:branched-chain amino acid transport system ATP-binding protein/nonpolar-amino-acid-transporting ATPase